MAEVLLTDRYRLTKPGDYTGELTCTVLPNISATAKFTIHVVEGSPDKVAEDLYNIWVRDKNSYKGDGRSDAGMALYRLSRFHSDAAIPYLKKLIADGPYSWSFACQGLQQIESPASARELIALCENNDRKDVAALCRALVVILYRQTQNQEIKEIVRPIAEKYPNAK
jgi:hypothetical protein